MVQHFSESDKETDILRNGRLMCFLWTVSVCSACFQQFEMFLKHPDVATFKRLGLRHGSSVEQVLLFPKRRSTITFVRMRSKQ